MKAKNRVISGYCMGNGIVNLGERIAIQKNLTNVILSSRTVEKYMIVGQENGKNTGSVVARGLIGGALLGGVGVLAGGLSAKNNGVNSVSIKFKDGKQCLIEIDNNMLAVLSNSLF